MFVDSKEGESTLEGNTYKNLVHGVNHNFLQPLQQAIIHLSNDSTFLVSFNTLLTCQKRFTYKGPNSILTRNSVLKFYNR